MSLAPIALFVYNRPDHTRRTIKFLRENLLAEESRLYIFSDAPRDAAAVQAVEEVREIIRATEGFRSVHITERNTNFGLANSIIDGVSMLNGEYGKVIVFEDDLLSSPFTLKYFNDALDRYQNEERVMHIGAYMYPVSSAGIPESFFHRIVTSWGWATWNRAWQHFNPDIDQLMAAFNSRKKYEFSVEGTMNFWKQMREFKQGRNNSWAIRWYASVYLRNGLALHPASSLVHNIGHDGTGVHSGTNDIYNVTIRHAQIKEFPTEIAENPIAHDRIKEFLKKRKGSLIQRIKRFLKQLR